MVSFGLDTDKLNRFDSALRFELLELNENVLKTFKDLDIGEFTDEVLQDIYKNGSINPLHKLDAKIHENEKSLHPAFLKAYRQEIASDMNLIKNKFHTAVIKLKAGFDMFPAMLYKFEDDQFEIDKDKRNEVIKGFEINLNNPVDVEFYQMLNEITGVLKKYPNLIKTLQDKTPNMIPNIGWMINITSAIDKDTLKINKNFIGIAYK